MASSETVLQIEGLTKVYRSIFTPAGVKAVDDLDLSVRRGETYSIVGPNGSGKTTTLKILLGLIFPTAGTASIFGKGIADLSVREQIGFLPEDAYLYDVFNGEELLNFYAGLFGFSKQRRRELTDELLSLVGMQANRKIPFRECSKGMRQRLALAQALVNDPELLILDEPTSGLDPAGRHQMTRLILELKRRGKTILLCSHFLAEVEEVCDRVGIMYRGRLVAEGTL
ncbi:MAG: ABC transporter ATP-binding protein, partial [Armatimonadetes bacterium]|nr:ABC transporter ATP-binding protein [Armatimonadota bacterium]